MSEKNQPLIPSLLYTQGDKNVKEDEEKDLEIPDPTATVAEIAIANAIEESQMKTGRIISASVTEGSKVRDASG